MSSPHRDIVVGRRRSGDERIAALRPQLEEVETDRLLWRCRLGWHPDCSRVETPTSVCVEGCHVSAIKRLVVTCAAAAVTVGAFATASEAQFRRRVRVVAPVFIGGGFYYDPFFYDPWYGIDGGWGLYPPYYRRYLPADASVKLDVKPSEAEVYVDGYYAGIVDDFDGAFQRLHVPPGEHEIELYLQGYRTVKQKVYLTADNTFKVKYNMDKLGAGEQPEPRPEPIAPPQAQGGQPPMQQPPYPPSPPPQRGPGRRMPPPPPPQQGGSARGGQQSGYGSVSIRVQPADADVSIDGEAWRSPAGQERLVVELSEGSHTIEIRKAGYRTYVTQVDVRRGDTSQLNVSLRSGGEQ
jgi:PEGA domain-containing protein